MFLRLCLLSFLCATLRSSSGVDHVHLIMSNHLDVGFTTTATNVINEYFDTYIPLAIKTAPQVKQKMNKNYRWMIQPWVVSMYLDCPPNIGFHCPTASDVSSFLAAVQEGIIWWHAFPFNSQLEAYDRSMVEFGIQLSKNLALKNGAPVPKTLSLRDVPGCTRSVVPILVANNVTALSIGANGGSAPPAVPSIFRWLDDSQNEIIAMMHGGGYGGIQLSDAIVIPGFNHALVMAWNSDNEGPPGFDETSQWYNTTAVNFPAAAAADGIFASTFDEFMDALYARPDIVASLPVYTQEMGDTWMYGIASDPYKAAAARIGQRERTRCLNANVENRCSLDDFAFFNFSRLLLKSYEHTWGGSIGKYANANQDGSIYYAWSNPEFRAALLSNHSNNGLQTLTRMWVEQRKWGLDYALQALSYSKSTAAQQLHSRLKQEWSDLVDVKSPLETNSQWVKVDMHQNFTVEMDSIKYLVRFDASGSLCQLKNLQTNVDYASESHLLGEFVYQTLDENDFNTYVNNYGDFWHSFVDMGKEKLNEYSNAEHQYVEIGLRDLYRMKGSPNEFLAVLGFSETLKKDYGPPHSIYNHFQFVGGSIRMNVSLINKNMTRMPEVLYLRQNPVGCYGWKVDKLGQMIRVSNVMLNGSAHIHAFTSHVSCDKGKGVTASATQMKFMSSDVPLVAFQPVVNESSPFYRQFTPFCTPLEPQMRVDQDAGFAFVLFNNIWGTNYPAWYPFLDQDRNSSFRFQIELE